MEKQESRKRKLFTNEISAIILYYELCNLYNYVSLIDKHVYKEVYQAKIQPKNPDNIKAHPQGLPKVSSTVTVVKPLTSTTDDGEVHIKLKNFSPSKSYLQLSSDSSGVLGDYNTKTKTVKVTKLKSGQKVKLNFIAKTGEFFSSQKVLGGERILKILPIESGGAIILGLDNKINRVDEYGQPVESFGGLKTLQLGAHTSDALVDGDHLVISFGSSIALVSIERGSIVKKKKDVAWGKEITGIQITNTGNYSIVTNNGDIAILDPKSFKMVNGLLHSDNRENRIIQFGRDKTSIFKGFNNKWYFLPTDSSFGGCFASYSHINYKQQDFGRCSMFLLDSKAKVTQLHQKNFAQSISHLFTSGGYLNLSILTNPTIYNGDVFVVSKRGNIQKISEIDDKLTGIISKDNMSIDGKIEQIKQGGDNWFISTDIGVLDVVNPKNFQTIAGESLKMELKQKYVGLTKPEITHIVTQPTTSTTTDGVVEFTFRDLNLHKTNLSLSEGSSGILGKYNKKTQTVEVTNLSTGDEVQVQVTPKNLPGDKINTWTDGTKEPFTSTSVEIIQTNTMVDKIKYSYFVTKPATIASSDGEVEFVIPDFNEKTMSIALEVGSQGQLEEYNKDTGTIKVTNLRNEQKAQVIIMLRGKNTWSDKTNTPSISPIILIEQTEIGLSKPNFSNSVINPTTTTSSDGEVEFLISNYDHKKMQIFISEGKKGFIGSFDAENKKIRVTIPNMVCKSQAQIFVKPKKGFSWKDGRSNKVKSNLVKIDQTTIGLVKPEFSSTVIKPTTTTSNDGEVEFTISGYNPEKMDVRLVSGLKSKLGEYNPETQKIKVMQLVQGQMVQIQVVIKSNDVWTDGTKNIVDSPIIAVTQRNVGLNIPTFATSIINPRTTSSRDGEVIFTLQNFDPAKMDAEITSGFKGELQEYDRKNHTIRVTGLINNQTTRIEIVLKPSQTWTSGSKEIIKSPVMEVKQENTGLTKPTFLGEVIKPKTTSSDDGEVEFTVVGYNPNIMKILLTPDSDGSLGKFDEETRKIKVLQLRSGCKAQIEVVFTNYREVWTDGSITPIQSSVIELHQENTGLEKPTFKSNLNVPTTSSSRDGEVVFTLEGFDPKKMKISLAPESKGKIVDEYNTETNSIKVVDLKSGQKARIQVQITNKEVWNNGTKELVLSNKIHVVQTHTGLSKPTFSNEVQQPNTTTSADGLVTFKVEGFDPKKMDLALVPGSNGIINKFNTNNSKIVVSDLANGNTTQLRVTLKKGKIWTDTTTDYIESSAVTMTQSNTGIVKPIFTHEVKQPNTSTSYDGEIEFTITGYNKKTMELFLASGSNGKLSEYDSKTHKVKVTDLDRNETAQIEIKLKNSKSCWTDGSYKPAYSQLINMKSGILKTKVTLVDEKEYFKLEDLDLKNRKITIAVDGEKIDLNISEADKEIQNIKKDNTQEMDYQHTKTRKITDKTENKKNDTQIISATYDQSSQTLTFSRSKDKVERPILKMSPLEYHLNVLKIKASLLKLSSKKIFRK